MHWRSKLIHPEGKAPEGFRSLATATYRGSTVVFESQDGIKEGWRQLERGYSYGLYGTPTALELGARIAELEGARYTFLVPSGQAAIALIWMTFCSAGSHALLPWSAYGPNKELAEGLLKRCNVDVELYDPLIGGGIANLLRPNTSLVWCESPGSITMEVQDVPAIVTACHAQGVPVALDNTYAAGVLFDAFAHGVDVSMQAVTKYIGGHSDVVMGSVSAGTEDAYNRLGTTWRQLGMGVSPDDCGLALRGLQTLGVRLKAMESATLEVATWLAQRPEIETILHPAFLSCPGHETWKRDFSGSASLFSIVFFERYSPQQVNAFVDALKFFKIGWSWGGVTSLAMAYPGLQRPGTKYGGRIVRLNIGLEEPSDLIADLAAAFSVLG